MKTDMSNAEGKLTKMQIATVRHFGCANGLAHLAELAERWADEAARKFTSIEARRIYVSNLIDRHIDRIASM